MNDKDLPTMTIEDKINCLEECINKAKSDMDYSAHMNIPEIFTLDEFYQHAEVVINNAKELILTNKIDNLNVDEQAEAYANYNSMLDACLLVFPEYIYMATRNL